MRLNIRHALLPGLLSGCLAAPVPGLHAQAQRQPVFIYASADFGAGTANHFGAQLHALFNGHYQVSLGYAAYLRKAANTPSDYQVDNFIFMGQPPQRYLNGFSAGFSYVLYSQTHRDQLRFPLGAGFLIGAYSQPENFHHVNSFLSSDYEYDDVAESSVAVVFHAGLEYTPFRAFGLDAGVYGSAGRLSCIGIYGGLMLGKVGDHAHHRRRRGRPAANF